MEGGTVAMVPARRLARVLVEARERHGETVAALAARSGGDFAATDLEALESASFGLDDSTVRRAVALYRVDPGVFEPERARLVVDLDERRLRAGSHTEPLAAPTADEVLATYLSLVYTMRHAAPGTALSLRDADISVLGRVLSLTSADVEHRLGDLMVAPASAVAAEHHRLARRILIPVAGALVAVTALGSLVFVNAGDDGTPVVPVGPAVTTVTEAPDVSLIPPVVMERGPDGQPGPQQTVVVDIGDAIVMERGPGGEPGPQVTR